MSKPNAIAGNWGMTGHEWAVEMLRQQIRGGTLRHAYLFSGPPGVGRRTLALRLAQALCCPNPAEAGEPCLACRTCRQIEAMQYTDLAVVQAEKEGGVLKVDAVRAVRQSLVLKPYQGRYRMALFLRFEEANASAANALLKTLEEAPEHAILVLTANAPEGLLPTIPSRCEVLRLRPLPVKEVEEMLAGGGAAAAQARLLAHISEGRPGMALRMLANPAMLETREKHLADLERLIEATRVEKFAYADKLSKDKDLLRGALVLWLGFWRDVLLRAAGSDVPLVNLDREALILNLAGRLGLEKSRALVVGMETAIERLDGNVNPRLLTEVVLLDWPKG